MTENKIQNERKLHSSIVQLVNELDKWYKKCVANVNDENAVHNYRVAIKKLTSLQEIDCKKRLNIFDEVIFKKHQTLFDSFGKLREWELFEGRYKKYLGKGALNESKNLNKYIDKKKKQAEAAVKSSINSLGNLKQSLVLHKLIERDYRVFEDCLDEMTEQNTTLMWNAAEDNKQWHPLRKHLKKCIYLCGLLGMPYRNDLIALEYLLGKWHDAGVQAKKAERYLKKHNDPAADVLMEKLKRRRRKLAQKVEEHLNAVTV